jgi:hypothetical protein
MLGLRAPTSATPSQLPGESPAGPPGPARGHVAATSHAVARTLGRVFAAWSRPNRRLRPGPAAAARPRAGPAGEPRPRQRCQWLRRSPGRRRLGVAVTRTVTVAGIHRDCQCPSLPLSGTEWQAGGALRESGRHSGGPRAMVF